MRCTVEYPKDFVAKAKALYPEDTRLHELLDHDDIFIEWHLNDGKEGKIDATLILEMLEYSEHSETECVRNFLGFVCNVAAKHELYTEWQRIAETQRNY